MVLVQQVNRGKPMVSSKVQCWRLWTQGTASLRHSHSDYSVPLADRMKLEWEEFFIVFRDFRDSKWNRFLLLIESRLVVDYCVGCCPGCHWPEVWHGCRVPLFVNLQCLFLSTCVLSVCDLYPTYPNLVLKSFCYLVSMPAESAFLSKNSSLCFGFSATVQLSFLPCMICFTQIGFWL